MFIQYYLIPLSSVEYYSRVLQCYKEFDLSTQGAFSLEAYATLRCILISPIFTTNGKERLYKRQQPPSI